MRRELTRRERRAVALGLLGAVAAAAYAFVAWPLVERHRAYDERIAELEHRLARYRRVAAQGPALEAALERIRRHAAGSGYYLESAKAALASAELQQHLKARIVRDGGQLVSTQVMAETAQGAFAGVAIRVHMRGSIESLRAVLHALETGSPLLFIDDILVTQGPRRPRNREAQTAMPLDIRFQVTGYTRNGSAS